MREKINNLKGSKNKQNTPNDLYRRFSNQFSGLCHHNHFISQENFIRSTYIKDSINTERLLSVTNGIGDIFVYLLGYTGSGKTTFIKNTFSIYNSSAKISGDTLYLPMFCNAMNLTKENIDYRFDAFLKSWRKELAVTFQDKVNLRERNDMCMDFHRFIHKNRADLLCLDSSVPDQTYIEELESLLKICPSAYELMLIKFYSLKRDIKTIVLILDDVESLEFAVEEKLVRSFLRVNECLKNNISIFGGYYDVKFILSGRLATYRHLKGQQWFQAFRSPQEVIYLNGIEDLSLLFKNRFKAINELVLEEKPPGNIDKWNSAYEKLMIISKDLYINYGKSILRINNYNISDSMTDFQRLISNRRWIQGNRKPDEYFDIESSHFFTNNAVVLKALACRENDIFFDGMAPIRNFMFNGRKEGKDSIVPLLLLKHFYKYTYSDHTNTGEFEIFDIHELYSYLQELFPEKYLKFFHYSIKRLLEQKILFQAPQDTDKKEPRFVFITPRGRELWDLFCNNSLLLELFREDLWRDQSMADFRETYQLSKTRNIY